MKTSWITPGITAMAMAGITLLSAAPAAAESYWSSAAPTAATSVRNLYEKTVSGYKIQLRVGKWGSNTYIWARAPKDANAEHKYIIVSVYNPSIKKWTQRSEQINNTTYTDAHRAKSGWGYQACTRTDPIGGAAAVCTSIWWV